MGEEQRRRVPLLGHMEPQLEATSPSVPSSTVWPMPWCSLESHMQPVFRGSCGSHLCADSAAGRTLRMLVGEGGNLVVPQPNCKPHLPCLGNHVSVLGVKRLRQFVPNTTCFIPPGVFKQWLVGRWWLLWSTRRPWRKRSPRIPGLFAGDNFFCRQIAITQSKTVAYLYNCNNDNQHLLSTQYIHQVLFRVLDMY